MSRSQRFKGIYSRQQLRKYFRSFLGQTLREIWTVVFEYGGEVEDWTRADPEFVFDEGDFWCTVIFGDKLRAMPGRWEDTLVYINRETFDFIQECGKHWKVDRSAESRYSNLVGKSLESVILIDNRFGDVAGVEFRFEDRVATFYVMGDEAWFIPGEARTRLCELQYEFTDVIR